MMKYLKETRRKAEEFLYSLRKKEVEEGVLYYTQEFIKGKLIDGDRLTEPANKLTLSNENLDKLVSMLNEGVWYMRHRCISVYRDAFKFNGDVYNICLSCGDFYKNGNLYYISNEEEIKQYLDNLKNK